MQNEEIEEIRGCLIGLRNDVPKLQQILGSRLYSDPYVFMIEAAQNATDSHRKMGKENIPFSVGLRYENGNYKFYIRDYGCSFPNKEEFVRLACTLLESDKTQEKDGSDNQTMGKYGIGKIAASAYQKKWEYKVYKDGKGFDSVVQEIEGKGIYHKETDYYETDESNGVYFEIEVKRFDIANFYNKMLEKLCYFQNINFEFDQTVVRFLNIRNIGTFNTDFIIYRGETFQFSTLNKQEELHICLDQYSYWIDWDEMGIEEIDIPIAIKFKLDESEVSPTRETIIKDENYKSKIKAKFKEVANELMKMYNASFPYKEYNEYGEFVKAYNTYISYELPLKGKTLNIKDFVNEYGDVDGKAPTFKGQSNEDYRTFNKYIRDSWRYIYKGEARILYGKLKRDKWLGSIEGMNYIIDKKIPTVTLNWIKSEYSTAHFVKHTPIPETSNFGIKDFFKFDLSKYSSDDEYKMVMDRKLKVHEIFMEGYHKTHFIKIEDVIIPEEWMVKHRASLPAKKSLKKLEGDVGIAFGRDSLANRYDNNDAVFEETIIKIADLHRQPFLCIYGIDKDKLNSLYKYKKIKIAMVKTTVEKKLDEMNLHNFINIEDLKKKIPKISNMITAGIVRKKLQPYENTIEHISIIKEYLSKPFAHDLQTLKDYSENVKKWETNFSSELEDIVETSKSWNMEKMSILNKILKDVDKFDFVETFEDAITRMTRYKNDIDEVRKGKLAIKSMMDVARQRKIKMDWQHYIIIENDGKETNK